MASKSPSRRRRVIPWLLLAAVLGGFLWDGSPLGGYLLRQAVRYKFREVRQLSPSEVVRWMRDPNRRPPLFVDARSAREFAVSHIDGAVRLDPANPDPAVLAGIPPGLPIVVYDGPGVVGAVMAVALGQAGFDRVSNLEGGMFRWANEGFPLVADQGPASRVDPGEGYWGWLLRRRLKR